MALVSLLVAWGLASLIFSGMSLSSSATARVSWDKFSLSIDGQRVFIK